MSQTSSRCVGITFTETMRGHPSTDPAQDYRARLQGGLPPAQANPAAASHRCGCVSDGYADAAPALVGAEVRYVLCSGDSVGEVDDDSAPFHLLGDDTAAALYRAKLQGLTLRGTILLALQSACSRLDLCATVGANERSTWADCRAPPECRASPAKVPARRGYDRLETTMAEIRELHPGRRERRRRGDEGPLHRHGAAHRTEPRRPTRNRRAGLRAHARGVRRDAGRGGGVATDGGGAGA